jgi:outer membrane biosynthesis protein TonB
LTRAPDPNEPVDLTAGFVSGSAALYTGGQTTASGTSTSAVYSQPAATGVMGGVGKPDAPLTPSGPDLSRRPAVTGGAEWRCPFPQEADAEQIDHAVVTIRVDVDRLGRALNAVVTREFGYGFAREARRCALQQRWSPALDVRGNAVRGSTTVNVRFDR